MKLREERSEMTWGSRGAAPVVWMGMCAGLYLASLVLACGGGG